MSVLASIFRVSPRACSGDMYAGVPNAVPYSVTCVVCIAFLAMPKSRSRGSPLQLGNQVVHRQFSFIRCRVQLFHQLAIQLACEWHQAGRLVALALFPLVERGARAVTVPIRNAGVVHAGNNLLRFAFLEIGLLHRLSMNRGIVSRARIRPRCYADFRRKLLLTHADAALCRSPAGAGRSMIACLRISWIAKGSVPIGTNGLSRLEPRSISHASQGA